MGKKGIPPEMLKKLQQELLDILLEFDRICKKYNIRYYLSDGTLLGAVRHQGFIPWDDDVDIEIFRPEYERFREVAKKEWDEHGRYYFQDSTTDADYNWPYGKFRKAGTRGVRPNQKGMLKRDGIFMDVLVVDVMPSTRPVQSIMYFLTTVARKILWAPIGWRILQNPFEKAGFFLLHLIPRNAALALHHWVSGWYRGKETEWIGIFNTASISKHGYAYRSEWYKDVREVSFEGHMLPIPVGADGILKTKYYDYWVLPPEEERYGNSDLAYIEFSDGTIWQRDEESRGKI